MDIVFSRPYPVLRDFRESPDPPPLYGMSHMASTVPIDLRLQSPAAPREIAVPHIAVSKKLTDELVPEVFGARAVEYLQMRRRRENAGENSDERVQDEEEADEDQKTTLSIEDTKLHRLLLHHALLGFTFESAPFCLRILIPSALQSSKNITDDRASQFEDSAEQFKHDILVFNMHMLSVLLCSSSGWAFTIALEPSPYYGLNGLEARLCIYGPRNRQLSFHLIGMSKAPEDIRRLHKVLKTLCSTARLKFLGVVTNLDEKEHATGLGTMVSAVIVYFARLAPQTRPFYTPDHSVQGKRPPLLPVELANAPIEDVKKLVNEYRGMLEVSWSPEDIAEIGKQHEALTTEPKENLSITGDSDRMTDEEPARVKRYSPDEFAKAWERVGSRFAKLRDFVGGLATAYLYAPKPRSRVGITAMEAAAEKRFSERRDPAVVTAEAADVVLQASQFEELRSYLHQ